MIINQARNIHFPVLRRADHTLLGGTVAEAAPVVRVERLHCAGGGRAGGGAGGGVVGGGMAGAEDGGEDDIVILLDCDEV